MTKSQQIWQFTDPLSENFKYVFHTQLTNVGAANNAAYVRLHPHYTTRHI